MNATTKKPGSTRAAFAIEGAIEDTRRKIAGSAQDLKKQAIEAMGPALTTERDGRAFAIVMLERLQNVSGDEATAYPYGTAEFYGADEIAPLRTGPQWDGFHRDLSRLLDASDEARKGFSSIFTDALANEGIGHPEQYRELESAGKLRAWGTPGTAYPKPRAQARDSAARKAAPRQIARGESEAIEGFLRGSGHARRSALAFLSRPYAEMEAMTKANADAAQGFAELAAELDEIKGVYLQIAMRINRAAADVRRAVAARGDGAALLKQAQREQRAK